MHATVNAVTAASLPASALPVLAGLRCTAGVRVRLLDERAWVSWQPGSDEVLHCVLTVPGVELYVQRGESWYRHGRHLPAFAAAFDGPAEPLDCVLTPAPVCPEPPLPLSAPPCQLRLERDERPRQAAALLCGIADLAAWAERATTASLEAVQAARCGAEVLLLGRRLPPILAGERFWGERVLVPLGFRLAPALPESAVMEALGLTDDELAVFRPDASDIIPRQVFQPLSRAGVRLARERGA
jgi:hypothetical protein